jgi:ribosomal protein L12E/L44/L45/RPP1/RPP2
MIFFVAGVNDGVLARAVSLATAAGGATDKEEEAAEEDDEEADEADEEDEDDENVEDVSIISMGHSLDIIAICSRPCELARSMYCSKGS